MQIKTCGEYSSDEKEINHDGTILSKIGLTYEEIKFDLSFDISIVLVSGTTFTGNVKVDLPVGDIMQSGTLTFDKSDFSDVIFKRS